MGKLEEQSVSRAGRARQAGRTAPVALLIAASVAATTGLPHPADAADKTCVNGIVRHRDNKGIARPSQDVGVTILDRDEGGQDDVLAVVRSDVAGAFSACVPGEESDEGSAPSGQDLFVRIEATTTLWGVTVTDPIVNAMAPLQYETCPCDHADVAAGSTVNFGIVSPSSEGKPELDPGFFAFDRARLVFDWFAPAGPAWTKFLHIVWGPELDVPELGYYKQDAAGKAFVVLDADMPYAFDGQVVMHEVAHHVMIDAYGYSLGEGDVHEVWELLSPETAFSEAFADWVSVEAIGTDDFAGDDVEIPTWDSPKAFTDGLLGQEVEMRVLALLHDLSDLDNEWPWDRSGDPSGGPGEVWNVIRALAPGTANEFIEGWLLLQEQGDQTPLDAAFRATLFQNTFDVDPDAYRFRESLEPSKTERRPPAYVEHGYQLPTSELAWSLLAISEGDEANHKRYLTIYRNALFASPASAVGTTPDAATRPAFVAVRGHDPELRGDAKVWYGGVGQDDKSDTKGYQVVRDPGIPRLNKNLMSLNFHVPLPGSPAIGIGGGGGVVQSTILWDLVYNGIEVVTLDGFEVGVEQSVRLSPLGDGADLMICLLPPDSEVHTNFTATCVDENGVGESEALTFTPNVPNGWGFVAIGAPPHLSQEPGGKQVAAILYVDHTEPGNVASGILCVVECNMYFRAVDPETSIGWVRWSFNGSLEGRPWVRWVPVSTATPKDDPVHAPASRDTDCPSASATSQAWSVEPCQELFGSLDELVEEDGVMHKAVYQVMNNAGITSPIQSYEYVAPIGGGSDLAGLAGFSAGQDGPTPQNDGDEGRKVSAEGSYAPRAILRSRLHQ